MAKYEVGVEYNRKEQVHGPAAAAGLAPGNSNAGITKVGGEQCIFWNPFRRRYQNRWIVEPDEFVYSGEGSSGDMTDTGGNASLLACEASGQEVLVFLKMASEGSRWKFLGPYKVAGHERGWSRGEDGEIRRDIRFSLAGQISPVEAGALGELPHVEPGAAPKTPLEEEIWRSLMASQRQGTARKRRPVQQRSKRQADPLKSLYALARAAHFGGACEMCEIKPTWVAEDGLPHYQVHHLNAEIDAVDWIAAVCGTCHDRLHHSTDRIEATSALRRVIASRQIKLGRPLSVIYRSGGSESTQVLSPPQK